MTGWRKLPPALLAMFVVEVGSLVLWVGGDLMRVPGGSSVRMQLVEGGLSFASYVLGIAGFLELARRSTGRLGAGFKLAAFGFAVGLANLVWWRVYQVWQPHWSFETMATLQQWTYFAAKLFPLLGVAVAAAASDRRAAIVAGCALVVTDPPPWVGQHVYGALASGWKAEIVMLGSLHLVALVVMVAVTARLVVPAAPATSSEATSGLRTISAGLWLRVIAACTIAGLMMMLVLGKAGTGAAGVVKLALISGAVVNAISFAMIARGALGSLVADMPAVPLVVAATSSLWCLGVGLTQLPYTYKMLYGGALYGDDYGSHARDFAEALSVVLPIVAIAAVAAVATAIAGFATRRGLDQLRVEAQGKGMGFVALMLASVGLQQWLLPTAGSEGAFVVMMLAAAAASLWATVLMARLCALAADSMQAEPGLPQATLV